MELKEHDLIRLTTGDDKPLVVNVNCIKKISPPDEGLTAFSNTAPRTGCWIQLIDSGATWVKQELDDVVKMIEGCRRPVRASALLEATDE